MQCPDDATLLALMEGRLDGEALRTVDTHLDECAICRDVVAELGSASGPRRRREPAAPGAAIGRFEVRREIGRGAMGIVLEAYDPELDRAVALKLLSRADASEATRARLAREAQALAKLNHPNVVTVYDVSRFEGDITIAMEFVDGQTLRAWLTAEPRSADAILGAFLAAGEGLAAAHDAGLVHRDFKPDNVLVDRQGRVKVTDFGLAGWDGRATSVDPEAPLEDAVLTKTGALLGTPAYMAPEQLRGEPVDARADQFAFSVALAEALEGERPFRGATVGELERAIASGARVGARTSRRVRRVLERGLASDRRSRFGDMRSLLDALRPAPRDGLVWPIAGLTAILGVAVLAAVLVAESRAAPCEASARALEDRRAAIDRLSVAPGVSAELRRWADAWTSARRDACEATQVRREQSAERMDRRMRCLDEERDALDAVLARIGSSDATNIALDAAETLPDPAACTGEGGPVAPPLADRDAVDALRRELEDARVLFATGGEAEVAERIGGLREDAIQLAYPSVLAEAERLRAEVAGRAAEYAEAEEAVDAAIAAAIEAGDDHGVAEGWLTAIRVDGDRGRFAEAARAARFAEAAIARAGDTPDRHLALLRLRGMVRTNLGDLAGAEADLVAARDAEIARAGADSPRVATVLAGLGNLYRVASRLDEALAAHERALAIDRAALGDDHPRVARDLHNVGGILRRLERAEEATERYERALAIKIAAFGEDHPEVALTRNSLGLMANEAGDHDRARALWESAAATFEAHGHGDAALSRFNLARLDVDQARFEDAVREARRAIEIDTARLGPRAKRVGSEHVVLAQALSSLQRREEAAEAARVALAIAEDVGDGPLGEDARGLLRVIAPATPPFFHPSPPRRPNAPPPEPASESALEGVAPSPPAPEVRPPRLTGSGAYGASQSWE
ncbi:MAG: tetratricopeptide repeat protein [Sandaracinaceae bacterium]